MQVLTNIQRNHTGYHNCTQKSNLLILVRLYSPFISLTAALDLLRVTRIPSPARMHALHIFMLTTYIFTYVALVGRQL